MGYDLLISKMVMLSTTATVKMEAGMLITVNGWAYKLKFDCPGEGEVVDWRKMVEGGWLGGGCLAGCCYGNNCLVIAEDR